MRSRLFVRSQEVHPILIEITKEYNKKKRASRALFIVHLLIKRKPNHHKQDTPVHPDWHRRKVPKH